MQLVRAAGIGQRQQHTGLDHRELGKRVRRRRSFLVVLRRGRRGIGHARERVEQRIERWWIEQRIEERVEQRIGRQLQQRIEQRIERKLQRRIEQQLQR
jgi:hypothetical protein